MMVLVISWCRRAPVIDPPTGYLPRPDSDFPRKPIRDQPPSPVVFQSGEFPENPIELQSIPIRPRGIGQRLTWSVKASDDSSSRIRIVVFSNYIRIIVSFGIISGEIDSVPKARILPGGDGDSTRVNCFLVNLATHIPFGIDTASQCETAIVVSRRINRIRAGEIWPIRIGDDRGRENRSGKVDVRPPEERCSTRGGRRQGSGR